MSGAGLLRLLAEAGGRLCLPPRLRPLLAAPPPRGRLLAGRRLPRYRCAVSVGDVVTRLLLDAGAVPRVAIVDCATMRRRGECPSREAWERSVRVSNPASTLSLEAVEALYSLLRGGGGLLVVEGEEDLLALPAILAVEQGCSVIYGLPGLAAAEVVADHHSKRHVWRILSLMKPCGPKA